LPFEQNRDLLRRAVKEITLDGRDDSVNYLARGILGRRR
jgi:hypothetical protein